MTKKIASLILLAALVSCVARAQEPSNTPQPTTPDQPLPPAGPDKSSSPKDATVVPAARSLWGLDFSAPTDDSDAYIPDTRPLSGSSVLTTGEPQSHRDFFDIGLTFSTGGDTGLTNTQQQTVLGSSTVVGGDLTYDHIWRVNRFSASYQGGGLLYNPSNPATYGNGTFQSLSLFEEFGSARCRVRLIDAGEYSPNASFGGAGLAGPGLLNEFGGAFSGLIPTFGTGGSILTGQGRRLDNSTVGEVEYDLSPRSAITFSASFGIVHFLDAGFIDDRSYVSRVGYNYQLTAKSAIALYGQAGRSYYSLFSTNSTGPGGSGTPGLLANTTDFGGGAAFSKQVTGRMVFQISGGPDWIKLLPNSTNGSPLQLSWNAFASVRYMFQRSSVMLSYSHALTPGSGVYSGALTDQVTTGYSRSLTRFFSAGVNGGYSLNRALVTSAGFSGQFSNWYAAVNAGQQFGRWMRFGLYYGAQQQIAAAACPVASCAATSPRQTFGFSLQYHPLANAPE